MAADEFSLVLDLSGLVEIKKELEAKLNKRLQAAAQNLSIQTHAHVKEEAAAKLHSRLSMFNDHLDFEQVDSNTWSIVVRQKARWIEDGMEPHSMLDDLLASPKAKRAKDGSKYLVVPFKHDKGPTQQTPHQAAIKDSLKKQLKALKIPYKKIERNPDGSPKTGLLHKLDLNSPSQRLGGGQHGPAHFPMATHHNQTGTEGPEGRPFLAGVRIYQNVKKNPDGSVKKDKSGHAQVSREVFTFRVASSKQANSWFHPGLAPMNFLEEAYNWAKQKWDTEIAPEIMRDL